MKFLLPILAFICLSSAFAQELSDVNLASNTYEQAGLPDFLPWVGKALPGRCFLATGSNKKIASVLMVSFEEEGFEVAPFDMEKGREDFFDGMEYEDVLKKFPLIKKMFLEVNETAIGAQIFKQVSEGSYKGEIRESEKYMILRVFINDKLYKYCNYIKVK